MPRDVFLNASSVITGLGNLEETWAALLANKTAVCRKKHLANPVLPETGLSMYHRELDTGSRHVTMGLLDESINSLPPLPENTFVIWTGIKNSVEDIESQKHLFERPLLKSASDYRRYVSERLGLNSGGMEINAACASSTVGVGLAVQWISEGRYDHILVAAADTVSRFVYLGFAALKAMKADVCRPLDVNRTGLSLGDGVSMLYLSSEKRSDIRLSGYGMSNDANHITGPSRDGAGLVQAFDSTVRMAGIKPQDVGAFCAHATATQYNDAMELMACKKYFGESVPPIFGVKGAIGHTLGAAGGIEIALCARCLLERRLLPTVGCLEPENPAVLMESCSFSGNTILTSNSGFGGVNAAVLLEIL